MEHNNNNKEQNNDREQCTKSENAFEYDIFLSYRYNDERDPSHPKRGVGEIMAKRLCGKLEREGYKVWFDKENPYTKAQSDLYMHKSKLSIVLITDYSMAGIDWPDAFSETAGDVSLTNNDETKEKEKVTTKCDDGVTSEPVNSGGGKGFLKELIAARFLLEDNKGNADDRKPRVLFVSVDGAFRDSEFKKRYFKWMPSDYTYANYRSCIFNFGGDDLLAWVKGSGIGQFNIQPTYKYRKPYGRLSHLTKVLVGLLVISGVIICWALIPSFLVVGPGSVREYFLSRGVSLNDRHTYYCHHHSDEAWNSLKTVFRYNTRGGLGKLPIALSDKEMDTTFAVKILGNKRQNHRILQIFIDSIDLEVLVLQDTSKKPILKIEEFLDTSIPLVDTFVLKKWYDKRDSLNLYIVANSPQSTTRKTFSSILCSKDGGHQGITTLSCDLEFRKYDIDDCYAIIGNQVRDSLRTVLVLDNSTIDNQRESIVDGLLAMQHFTVVGKRIPLYAYTIVKIEDNNKIKFLNRQEDFFKYTLRMKIDTDLRDNKDANRVVNLIIKKKWKVGEDNRFFTKLRSFFMSI